MRRRTFVAMIVLIGLFASPYALSAEEQQHLMPATIIRVLDGDTVEVILENGARQRVRLIGVDCPELTDKDPSVRDYAFAAAAFTRELLEGRRVWLETDMGTLDKYGRLLAYVWTAPPADFAEEKIRDCMFNAILLLEGYAYTYMLMPNTKYAEVFVGFQHEAIMEGRGIWGTMTRWIHIIVYVTNTGKKYHGDGCRYLASSRIPMTLAEAMWRRYERCQTCKPPYWMSAGISLE